MRDRHSHERQRFYAIARALYDESLAAMPERKRRNPHHRKRAQLAAFKSAYSLSNRAQRRALERR